MFGEVVTFIHRNMRTLLLATPVIAIATGALVEFSRLPH
jgi:hypothetical protein